MGEGAQGATILLLRTLSERPATAEQTSGKDEEHSCRIRESARLLGAKSSRQGRLGGRCPPQARSRARSTTTMTKVATDIKTCHDP